MTIQFSHSLECVFSKNYSSHEHVVIVVLIRCNLGRVSELQVILTI